MNLAVSTVCSYLLICSSSAKLKGFCPPALTARVFFMTETVNCLNIQCFFCSYLLSSYVVACPL